MFVGMVVGVDVWEIVGYGVVVGGGSIGFWMMVGYCCNEGFGVLLNWYAIECWVRVGLGYVYVL